MMLMSPDYPDKADLQASANDVGQLNAEQLCEFVLETSRLDPRRKPGPDLARMITRIFQLDSTGILDSDLQEVYTSGDCPEQVAEILQNIRTFGTVHDDPMTGISRRVIRMGNLPIGALLVRGEIQGRMVCTIASMLAVTFDRYHALANESRTEIARQTEQLRTTVLDSLAHAYKTPLTAIAAASQGFGAMGALTPSQASLISVIDEQTDLLNRLTTQLLRTARLDASDMVPRAERVFIAGLLEDIVASMGDRFVRSPIKVSISREDLSMHCDRGLLIALLTQYLDNAAKYGTPGEPVTIQVTEQPSQITFSVHNFGPSIPKDDFERIFDRYYRSSASSNKAQGTGIGLSVAKRSAQAQGGHVWVTSDSSKGTTFYASLPIVPPRSALNGVLAE